MPYGDRRCRRATGSGPGGGTRGKLEFLAVVARCDVDGSPAKTLVDIGDLLTDRPRHTGGQAQLDVVSAVEPMTNLADVPDAGFRFRAVSVETRAMGTFPVRAFAEVD